MGRARLFVFIDGKSAWREFTPSAACKAGRQPCANFENSAPLAEMVLLGNVALLSETPIEWDVQSMQIKGNPEAERFIRREYRKGWTL